MKRRLTNKQTDRIQKTQDKELIFSGPEQTGQIIAHYGQTLEVTPLQSEKNSTPILCFAKQNLGPLVTGDQVVFRAISTEAQTSSENQFFITARLPRTSLLQRPDIYKGHKPIAANIDQIFLVIAVSPAPIEHAIDRALVLAQAQNIPIKIILNKTDLLKTANAITLDFFKNLSQRYEKIGYEVIRTSAVINNLDTLGQAILEKTNIFVGQSGVGKSSLINSLFGDALAKTGEISEANQRGKHTTTTARLYKTPEGSALIDAPGIREFGVWDLTPDELLNGFIEFKPYLNQCQFRNCSHQINAQGCALHQAVSNNLISSERLNSYLRLLEKLQP